MKAFSRIKRNFKRTHLKEIYVVFNKIGQLIYIGNHNGYRKLNIFSKVRTTIIRIFNKAKRTFVIVTVVTVINGFLYSPMAIDRAIEPANSIGFQNPSPLMERQIISSNEQSCKIKVGPSPTLNEFKGSDKIQMLPFSRPSFKYLAPYVFLNGSNRHGFYKFFHMKGGFQDKYGGLLILTIMIFILTQDAGAFAPAFRAFQKLASFNAPTASWPGMGSQGRIYTTREQEQFNVFLQKFNQPKKTCVFVMTSDEAEQKLNEAYPGKMEIGPGQFVSDKKAAAKIYHASQLGLNPEDYNVTPENLKRLNEIGLNAYAREGRPLPSIEFVQDYQKAIKKICTNGQSMNGTYSSSGENKIHPARYFYNKDTREIVGFYQETGDLITVTKYRIKMFNNFLLTKNLGHLK